MPASHRAHLEWTPTRLVTWGATIGAPVAELMETMLRTRPHPEHGYRSCLGILRLGKRYGNARLEAACGRAFSVGARSYRHVDAILKNGLDRMPVEPAEPPEPPRGDHENVRGPDYYH